MIVYRLELIGTPTNGDVNQGVYRGEGSCHTGITLDGTVDPMVPAYEYNDNHPTPQHDPLLSRVRHLLSENHVFCFDSEQSLRQWFSKIDGADEYLLLLVQIGVYYVPDNKYLKGTFQVVAEASHMKRVDTWRPERR